MEKEERLKKLEEFIVETYSPLVGSLSPLTTEDVVQLLADLKHLCFDLRMPYQDISYRAEKLWLVEDTKPLRGH